MSLYGDLPQAKDEDAGAKGWASASKKLQPTFRPKQAGAPGSSSLLAVPPSVRAGAGRTGGRTASSDGGRGGGRGPPPVVHVSATGSFSSTSPAAALTGPSAAQHSSFSFLKAVNGEALKDEYDPSKPNDYEEIMREREQRKREAEEQAERAARLREAEQEIERRKREQAEAAAFIAAAAKPPPGMQPPAPVSSVEDDDEFVFKGGLGAAAQQPQQQPEAPAAGPASTAGAGAGAEDVDEYERERQRRLRMSGDEAFAARARLSGASPAGHPPSSSAQTPPSSGFGGPPQHPAAAAGAAGAAPKGMGLAQKLLEKMGWREGQGLGRHRQGMATPLVAQKTAAHAGVIVNAELPPDKRPKLQGAAFNGPPTRVLVLRNMVVPGEVDEDLEEEVGNELTKYGNVEDVMIFEVTTAGYPPEEAVRIFIKFDRAEASTRALVDLQGRFFGGRQVRVAFFSEDRFDKQQLAPQAGEFGDS